MPTSLSLQHCTVCAEELDYSSYADSENHFGNALCSSCTQSLGKQRIPSQQAVQLFMNLKARAIPAILEYYDGFKTVDIAIPSIPLYIEIDGSHHYTDPNQAFNDLLKDYYSLKQEVATFHLPNIIFPRYITEIGDCITQLYQTAKNNPEEIVY